MLAANAVDADAASLLAPLDGYPSELELLDGVDKLGFVSVPLGSREPRPIMIALHGGSDRPELACAAWRGVTEAYPFVVCPRGFGGTDRRLGWRGAADTSARIARAVDAAKAIFGKRVLATQSVVLSGFSMGATQVALVAAAEPARYSRIVVGDSAHDPKSAQTFAHAWVANHDASERRVLFLCTTSGCEPSLRRAAQNASKESVAARLNIAPTRVHALSPQVVESLRRDWPWLVEGAEGWQTYVAPKTSFAGKTERFDPN